jgi:cytochrome P450 family 110
MNRLPPGPGRVLITTVAYLRDPYRRLLEYERRYGDPFTLSGFLGPMVVTGDPAGLQTVLTADPDTYVALGAELLAPVLGESNLILLSGERHRAMRRLQTPPFQGARMRAYGRLILRVAEEQSARWPRDRSFDVHRTMRDISLQVILQAVLGLDEPERRQTFKDGILDVITALKPSFMFIRGLRRPLAGLSAWARFQRKKEAVVALFQDELRARRADSKPREDILSLFMAARHEDGSALSEQELFEQMMNIVAAGHETTASSLAWALHHLHREDAVKRRLTAELEALPAGALDPEQVVRLPYLDAVCSETLRLEPVAPVVGRTLRKSLTLLGYDLPPGVSVGISILNLHRRPDLYVEPERFRPERFLERTYSPFEYLPFGGGARRCLGAAFAVYEMKLVLAAVLRHHHLVPTRTKPIRAVMRNTTAGPAGPIDMRLA